MRDDIAALNDNDVDSRWTAHKLRRALARSVWQWQLILTFTVVVIGVAVALLDTHLFGVWPFTVGMLLIVAVGIVCLVVDWSSASKKTVLLVPLANTFAIGLLSVASPAFGFLWCFPIAWISTYFALPALALALAIVLGTLLTGWWAEGRTPEATMTLLVVVLSLGFLGITVSTGTRRTRAVRYLMRSQSQQLDRALHRVSAQEQRSAALFDSISVALAGVDERGNIIAANTAYRALYSFSDDLHYPARAVEYADYRGHARPPNDISIARAARGERVTGERLWLYDADGTWRALSLSIHDRDNDQSGARGAVIEITDDTEPVRYRDEIRARASAISHELRNPLTAILGHADLLLEGEALAPSDRAHAAVIQDAGERMLVLIRGLLDSAQTPEPVDHLFDLGQIVASALAAFTPSASASELSIVDRLTGDLIVNGDGFRVRQVVDNLLSNAIKYTPRGGTVTLSTRCLEDRVEFVVADSGIGIAADDLEHVFDPYFRAQSATDSGVAGTGLGMGISREIVRGQGGELTVGSRLGEGTTATLTLPAAPPSPFQPPAEGDRE